METRLHDYEVFDLLGLLRRSSNYTFLARLSHDSEELLVVYKPARGESPLWDFPPETLYRREVASYLLAKALGWPRIPPTVVREEAPHGIGAVQLFIDADPARHYLTSNDADEVWVEVALFDVVANNADRKSGHCLADRDGHTWAIDHGLTFHEDPKLRTVIWDYAGQPVPDRLRADLSRACAELESGPLGRAMAGLLSRPELAALRRRMARAGSPGWHLPQPGSAWSVPWPPV